MIGLLNLQNPNYYNLYFIFPCFCLWLVILYTIREKNNVFLSQVIFFLKICLKFSWISVVFLVILICYALYLPLSYDESFTFIQFVNRSTFYAACTYPAPNNHVLHSVLSNILWHVFGWTNLALIVRIPSILASCFLMNVFITKISKTNVFYSGLFLILLLFNLPYLSFSFQARGYAMEILFAVISSVIIFQSTQFKTFNDKQYLILFFSLLGLYTSPAYLYTFLPLYTSFLLLNITDSLRSIKLIIKSALFFGLTIVLLYAPIIVFRGYEPIIHNRFVAPLDHLSFLDALFHLINAFSEVLGGQIISVLIFSLTLYFSVVKRRFAIIPLFALPLLLMLVLKQTPFTRVFLPLAIVLVVIAIADLRSTLKNKKQFKPMLVPIFIGISLVISALLFFEKPNGGIETSFSVKKLSKYFNHKNIYLEPKTHDYLKVPIEAYLQLSDIKYSKLDRSTKLKEGSILIFSEWSRKNIKILDSVPSLDKIVYVGKVEF